MKTGLFWGLLNRMVDRVGEWEGDWMEWVAYPFSRGSSQSRNQTGVSCIALHCSQIPQGQGSPQSTQQEPESHRA